MTTPGRQRAAVQDICSMADRTGAARQHSWGGQAAETLHPASQGRIPTGPPCTSSVYQRISPTSNTQHECCENPVPHPWGLRSLTPSVGLSSSTVSPRQAHHSLECGSHGWRYGEPVHPPWHSCDSWDAVRRPAPALPGRNTGMQVPSAPGTANTATPLWELPAGAVTTAWHRSCGWEAALQPSPEAQ